MSKYNITLPNGTKIIVRDTRFANTQSTQRWFEVMKGDVLIFTTQISSDWEGYEHYLKLCDEWREVSKKRLAEIMPITEEACSRLWTLFNGKLAASGSDGIPLSAIREFAYWARERNFKIFESTAELNAISAQITEAYRQHDDEALTSKRQKLLDRINNVLYPRHQRIKAADEARALKHFRRFRNAHSNRVWRSLKKSLARTKKELPVGKT